MFFILAFSCNEPLQVTAKPDDRAATSRTLGSADAENNLPDQTRDTATRPDTLIRRTDSL